ncbi:S53 family peptidase [Sinomonas sp. ASV322]|uniref:S53 family peptidase n=1 Tax=Sinomonas sp. ASV322 TaxID=3041920 RepID=UPI0027DC517E|nr:S53 family peptidase [Sinomonas sp. ASV322]MDQ4502875.1 S53 family peptidase [Sinomonas sp. ASV322]
MPPWAGSRAKTGIPLSNTTVEGEIYFNLRDLAGAKATADAVSTPGSASYGQFLAPQQWIDTYAPTQATLDATVAWLKAQGMTITGIPDSRLYVVFRGTVNQINAAFNTVEQSYSFQGQTLIGPATAPSVPAELGDAIQSVSVDQGKLLTRPANVTPDSGETPAATGAITPPVSVPCSHYWGEKTATLPEAYQTTTFPTFLCGYTPTQLQGVYGIAPTGTVNATAGAGQTVAIIDAYASPTIVEDTNAWAAASGVPQLAPGQYQQIVPDPRMFLDKDLCAEPSGWQGEQSLDVQAVHGLAPAAGILYVGGNNCGGGLDLAMSKILDGHLANIVSNSYGNVGEALPPNTLMGEQNIHLQAAAEGIGLYFSSGDSGDEKKALGYASPDFAASSPYVTAVGGTSLAAGKDGEYLFETGWGTARQRVVPNASGQLVYAGSLPGPFRFGAGGGTSAVFEQPAYQKALVPTSLACSTTSAKCFRVSPDVSALADPYTGYRIGYSPITNDNVLKTGSFGLSDIGGTSLACPLTAAQMAVAQAATGKVIGFANPTIYAAAASGGAQRDVVPPSSPVSVAFSSTVSGNSYLVGMDHDSSLFTAPGYDNVTGVGSMTEAFAQQVAQQH